MSERNTGGRYRCEDCGATYEEPPVGVDGPTCGHCGSALERDESHREAHVEIASSHSHFDDILDELNQLVTDNALEPSNDEWQVVGVVVSGGTIKFTVRYRDTGRGHEARTDD